MLLFSSIDLFWPQMHYFKSPHMQHKASLVIFLLYSIPLVPEK